MEKKPLPSYCYGIGQMENAYSQRICFTCYTKGPTKFSAYLEKNDESNQHLKVSSEKRMIYVRENNK
jgi:hypothetical protein